MSPKSDLDLLDDFRRHQDQQAFAALVERHAGWVYGLCLRVTGRAAEAEEASSDAFFELARCANRIRERLPAWLHTVARRQSAQVIGRRSAAVAHRVDVAARPAQRADLEHLDEALAELTAELRAVLVLRFLANYSQEQIARQLSVSQATVSRRITEALAAMRTALDRRGAAWGVAPASLFPTPPCAPLPAHTAHALRRIALVARPPAAVSRRRYVALGGVALLLGGASLLAWHTPRPAAPAVPAQRAAGGPAASSPGQAGVQPLASGLLGWTDRIVHIDAADVALRHLLGKARIITAIDGQAVVRWELANFPVGPAARVTLAVLDPDGRARRIPDVQITHLGTALAWDPRGGVATGPWDADIARAAAWWRDQPLQALAAIDTARAGGCPAGELAVLATAAAAEADRPAAAQRWSRQVPLARLDRWMADLELHAVLRAHGLLQAARAPLANLSAGLGRLPADLPDADQAPAFPSAWHPLMDQGEDFSYGSVHIWDATHLELASAPLGEALAVETQGEVFTAMPGLARSQDLSGIYLSPVFADGHRPDIRACVGVLLKDCAVTQLCDGSGALIPRLPSGGGAIDLRLLVTAQTCALWLDGRLCALAPNRHRGSWRMVISGTACDLYLPHFRITSPDAALHDDLQSAIVADDARAVRRRLHAGDDPHRPFPDSREAPLCIAASADRTQAITALLEDSRVSVSDIDQTQATALYRAVDNHALAAARLLAGRQAPISPRNRFGITPLGYACRSRDRTLVDLLLDHGALTSSDRPDGTGPALDLMCPGLGAMQIVDAFRSHHLPVTPRALAIIGDDPGALAALTAETDQTVRARRGAALLSAAVLLEDQALMDRCLAAGIPAGVQDPGTGMSAVQLAIVVTGNLDLAKDLVAHGASPGSSCKYGTMADLASENGFPLAELCAPTAAPGQGF